jgi:hypothetical protein
MAESSNGIIYAVAIAMYFLFTFMRFRRNHRHQPICPCFRRRNNNRGSIANGGRTTNNNADGDAAYREFLERTRISQQQESLEQRRSFILDNIVVQKMETILKSYSSDTKKTSELSKKSSNDEENTIDEHGEEDSISDTLERDTEGDVEMVVRMEEGIVESDDDSHDSDVNSHEEEDEGVNRQTENSDDGEEGITPDEEEGITPDEENNDTNNNDPADDQSDDEQNQQNDAQDSDSIARDREESNTNNNNETENVTETETETVTVTETTRPTLNDSVKSMFTSFKKSLRFGLTSPTTTEDPPEELICSICLTDFEDEQDVCTSKNIDCKHVFHLSCMMEWLMHHDECPLCRHDYLKDSSSSLDDTESNGLRRRNPNIPPFPVSI